MLIHEQARNELAALQRRPQSGVLLISGTIIFGFFLPIIAVFGYIGVSILFFISLTRPSHGRNGGEKGRVPRRQPEKSMPSFNRPARQYFITFIWI